MLFQKVKPKTYRDMVALESGIHSTFRWQNGQQGYFDVDKFIEMTTTNDFKYIHVSRGKIFMII